MIFEINVFTFKMFIGCNFLNDFTRILNSVQSSKCVFACRYVAVRFKTKEDRAAAIKEVEELKLGWKIRIRKVKKEKVKERENNIYDSFGL